MCFRNLCDVDAEEKVLETVMLLMERKHHIRMRLCKRVKKVRGVSDILGEEKWCSSTEFEDFCDCSIA